MSKRSKISTIKILAAALLTLSSPAFARQSSPNVLDLRESITDNAIVYPETFEANTQKLLEGWYLKNYTTTDDRYERLGDPDVSDAEMRKRLADLPTVIDMPYNQIVRSYIDRYTKRSRQQVAAILGLNTYYGPIFEQALEAQGLPLELKYLPVIESGLDPNAVSRHGAAGLWQLMLGTGKGLGLEVNSLVDERRDPYMSSEKAVGYLKDLYATYGDWSLAIAAYNCGPGAVNKALRRAGGDPKTHDFWSIYRFLPEETRGYVPMFIAANYVMEYYPEHNISPVLATKPLVTDTVAVNCRLHFNQIGEVLNIPVGELRILNPQFRADIIPGTPERTYHLILPSQQVQAYIVSEEDIIAHDADKYSRRETAEPGDVAFNPSEVDNIPVDVAEREREEQAIIDSRKETADRSTTPQAVKTEKETPKKTVIHKVAAGETLASIAKNYDVEQSDIKSWNNLRRNAVRTGQQLRILVADNSAVETPAAPAKTSKAPKTSKADKSEKASSSVAKEMNSGKDKAKGKDKSATSKDKKNKGKNSRKQQKAKPAKPETHTVKSGDSLEKIAKTNGTTVEALRKSNPNLKGDMIHPGDKINIPAKATTSKSKGSKSSKTSKSSKGSKSSKSKKGKKK